MISICLQMVDENILCLQIHCVYALSPWSHAVADYENWMGFKGKHNGIITHDQTANSILDQKSEICRLINDLFV